jgi:rhodanese-related sulfurtransferase
MRHLSPKQTWALIQASASSTPPAPQPLFIDVRMEIEMLYVGRPPGVEHVPWYEYPDLTPSPAEFCDTIARLGDGRKDRTVVLLCRSGQRSVYAGQALEAAGFTDVVNVLHGFEGDLNDDFHRSALNGWRFDGLPWEQM